MAAAHGDRRSSYTSTNRPAVTHDPNRELVVGKTFDRRSGKIAPSRKQLRSLRRTPTKSPTSIRRWNSCHGR